MKYYLYIILTVHDTLYCGITNDVKKRYNAHLNKKGAKYTISHPPKEIVYIEEFNNKSDALKQEYNIKHNFSKEEKAELIKKNIDRTKKYLEIFFV